MTVVSQEPTALVRRALGLLGDLEQRAVAVLRRVAIPLLQVSLGLVFVWFGALKVANVTPVGELVAGTLPFVDPAWFVPFLGAVEVALGRLEAAQQRSERSVDGGQPLRQRSGVIPHGLEAVGNAGHAPARIEECPRDRDQVAGEGEDDQGHRDQRQDQQHQRVLRHRSSSTVATVLSFRSTAPAASSVSPATVIVVSRAVTWRVWSTMPAAAVRVSAA